ncbi:hypothetical protein AAZX31_06G000400 [Glycine max]
MVSGLKINFAKSCFGAFGMTDRWKIEAVSCLNCSLLPIPFVYLGIPIGANPRRCHMWNPILEKCERVLNKWTQRHLSFGGRVTLIQSILTSLPIYFFSFFRILKKVVEKLVSIQRRFLWGGGTDQNKIAWIKWETVCLPKDKGGLGIKDINTFNIALLGKWRWNLFQHEGQLWARVLESKYRGWRGLDEAHRDNHESIWWRDLKLVFQNLQGVEMHNSIEWRPGCGDRIKFWEDKWMDGEESLAAKYPRLYLISCQQNQIIQHMGGYKEADWEWNFLWRRPLFDNEIPMAVNFLQHIESKPIQIHKRDEWVWTADPSEQYTAKSAYKMMRGGGGRHRWDTGQGF